MLTSGGGGAHHSHCECSSESIHSFLLPQGRERKRREERVEGKKRAGDGKREREGRREGEINGAKQKLRLK